MPNKEVGCGWEDVAPNREVDWGCEDVEPNGEVEVPVDVDGRAEPNPLKSDGLAG